MFLQRTALRINAARPLDYTVHALWQAADKAPLLKDIAPRIRGLVTSGGVGADRTLIEALPKLEIISSFGVGYDPIDIDCAKERKVVVTNTPDVMPDDVAEIAIAPMLPMMRRMPHGDAFVPHGRCVNNRAP